MTANKLLSRLLRMEGFKVTWFHFNRTDNILELGVKPHKTGCRCPHCGYRGKIVARSTSRQWDDVVVCGMRSFFFMHPQRYSARLTAVFKNGYRGRTAMHVSPTGWNI